MAARLLPMMPGGSNRSCFHILNSVAIAAPERSPPLTSSSSHRLSPDRGFRGGALALALLVAMSAESFARPPLRAYLPDEPKLFRTGAGFRLKVNGSKTTPVTRSWLVPDDLDEAGRYVSSVNYSETVHAFAIGGTGMSRSMLKS